MSSKGAEMGFATPARRSAKVAGIGCDHEGLWEYRALDNGLAVRFCSGCGLTSMLLQNGQGAFLLVEVPEHGTEKWDDVSLYEVEEAEPEQAEQAEEAEAEAEEEGEGDGEEAPAAESC